MIKLWDWFNGKKTNIGAVLLFVAVFFTEVLVGKWNLAGTWVQPLIETLNWIGMALTGGGLVHKAVKYKGA